MDVREKVAYALLAGNLRDDPLKETARDIIHALSFCSRTASALIRFKYAHDAKSYQPAYLLLADLFKDWWPKTRPAVIEAMCKRIVDEWVIEKCRHCQGRGFLPARTQRPVPKLCASCGGTARLKVNGVERAKLIGLSHQAYYKTWEARFTKVWNTVHMIEGEAFGMVWHRLNDEQRAQIEHEIAIAKIGD